MIEHSSSTIETIQWGIIGCGDVAEVKSGPAFQNTSQSDLLAVMRRNGDKARDFAERHGVRYWYDDADKLIDNPEVNAVYIATPPSSHFTYAMRCIEAGKNIYLEKPFGLSSQEGHRMARALTHSTSKLTVAHYRRKMDAFLKVQELLAQKAIGQIRFVDLRILQPNRTSMIAQTEENWRLNPQISGGGYFRDLAPHQIDLMISWFGQPVQVKGFAANQQRIYTPPDLVQGMIEFSDHIQFRGIWAFNVAESDQTDRCTIYGSQGSVSFSFFGDEVLLDRPDSNEIFQFPAIPHVQQPMISETVQYFLGNGENPCSLKDAITGMEVMEAMEEL